MKSLLLESQGKNMIIKPEPAIYLIYCLANRKSYVGQSKSVKMRIANHQTRLRNGVHRNSHLQSAYDKYGADMFVFRVLEYPEDAGVENLTIREQYWIDQFNCMDREQGFNRMEAGSTGSPSEETKQKMSESAKRRSENPEYIKRLSEANTGKKHSEETRRKISEVQIGKISPKRGVPLSEEQKQKLREANLGKKQSEETIAKRSASAMGKKRGPMSEETKRKLSEANKGRKHTEETRQKMSGPRGHKKTNQALLADELREQENAA